MVILRSASRNATGLVNNAGFGTHNTFTDEDPEPLQSMIALNVGALVDLSRAYIDPLTSAGTGILINVASLLGFQPTPYLSVCGATVTMALDTLDRRSAPPSVITNGRPLALTSKFLPRRLVVRIMGTSQRRAMSHA